MSDPKRMRSGTYRCPVCGHRDVAEMEDDRGTLVIACSYCNTPLELSSRGPDSLRFSVQVSEQSALR